MSSDVNKLKKLNELISLSVKTKHILVLDPKERNTETEEFDRSVVYDPIEWKMNDELKEYVKELSANTRLSTEDKILKIFEKVCMDYVYDDNLISYIKKVDDDIYSLPDWYARDVDNDWEKNRELHNRRVCFELSRYIAEALKELLRENDDYNIGIFWNKNLIHYFVGLTCSEYSVTLDTDDFFNIKDLTRLKTGLTAEGITVLEDKHGIFKSALEKFNDGRSKYAIKKMEEETSKNDMESDEEDNRDDENEEVTFFRKAVEILKNNYNIDSQGIYEYIKEIVDIRIGSERREKIWKRIEGNSKESTRYIRGLVLDIEGKKYLIDVDEKTVRPFNEEELRKKRTCFIPYNELNRGGFDYYDGT